MTTIAKRISVSIPSDIEKDLDILKQKKFYKDSQSEMLRQLLVLGLQASKKKMKEEKFNNGQRDTNF